MAGKNDRVWHSSGKKFRVMKKTTFYGLAALCGVGSLLVCYGFLVMEPPSCELPKSAWVDRDFITIANAFKNYGMNAGRPPTTAQGIDAFVNEPTRSPKPRRWVQVMKELPIDPWGTPYRYTLLDPKEYEWRWELRSAGMDRVFGTSDDQSVEEETGRKLASIPEEPEAKLEPRPSF